MAFNRPFYRRGRLPLFFLFSVAKAFALAVPVMILWNYVLPPVVRVSPITYWQALALWLLCRILLGGAAQHNWGAPPGWKGGAARNKWMRMTPEEREKFQQEWKQRCGSRRNT